MRQTSSSSSHISSSGSLLHHHLSRRQMGTQGSQPAAPCHGDRQRPSRPHHHRARQPQHSRRSGRAGQTCTASGRRWRLSAWCAAWTSPSSAGKPPSLCLALDAVAFLLSRMAGLAGGTAPRFAWVQSCCVRLPTLPASHHPCLAPPAGSCWAARRWTGRPLETTSAAARRRCAASTGSSRWAAGALLHSHC